ncbi:S8 family serine peptidase [Terricaulis silvestris]|uniref:Subtilisin E n=1 Tax=Terricaulis silvestris TaxID=2686094 RepID=A0A6I6MJY3_9CAUL|nr:S8 family serine peptidase [Terricaulis silvestris]QGZ94989.1 Subtilisin E precursor [Terricaulis silvestris]
MLFKRLLILAVAVAAASVASAQVLPGVPGVGGTVGGVLSDPLGEVEQTTRDVSRVSTRELRNARDVAARQLLRRYPNQIDTDPDGAIVVRREIVAIAPSEAALAAAQARGFTVGAAVESGDLGLNVVVLRAPANMPTRRAVELLREIDPDGAYDYNHIYLGAGDTPSIAKQARDRTGSTAGVRIGLIDSGVDADHPAFAGANIQQRGFGGEARVGAHGTAVASLIAGTQGAAPGATLYVADVYGGAPTGGGATAIVAALGWLVQSHARVINISLVGPNNRAVDAAVRAAIARGAVIVAAVGNDGPAAAPLYPASYPGVVGVTGVDARNRVLPEAGRGAQVDFAAPGSDFSAASLGRRYAAIRGTSYAAPIVTGLLARAGGNAAALANDAIDLGPRGADRTFGAGLVGQDIRDSARRLARR